MQATKKGQDLRLLGAAPWSEESFFKLKTLCIYTLTGVWHKELCLFALFGLISDNDSHQTGSLHCIVFGAFS